MYLLLSIILATLLGVLLFELDVFIGSTIAFGIVLGCLFRGIYLLNDIREMLSEVVSKCDKETNTIDRIMEVKEKINQRK